MKKIKRMKKMKKDNKKRMKKTMKDNKKRIKEEFDGKYECDFVGFEKKINPITIRPFQRFIGCKKQMRSCQLDSS